MTCFAVLAVAAPLAAQERPTPPEKRHRMIRLIEGLEKNPYGPDAKRHRSVVMAWLVNASDVPVVLCRALLLDVHKFKGEEGAALVGQLAFSEAKFVLENPDRASNEKAVHLAGVEGVLRAYAAMKAARPELSIAPMEELAAAQAEGRLAEVVESASAQCH